MERFPVAQGMGKIEATKNSREANFRVLCVLQRLCGLSLDFSAA
jgi:hypothetical protein